MITAVRTPGLLQVSSICFALRSIMRAGGAPRHLDLVLGMTRSLPEVVRQPERALRRQDLAAPAHAYPLRAALAGGPLRATSG